MGEYAEEAIQDGLCEDFRKESDNRDYNYIWRDVTGTHRLIHNMTSLHLCFVLDYILKGKSGVPVIRADLMREVLIDRGYSENLLMEECKKLKEGTLTMYYRLSDYGVTSYYKSLLEKYPNYNWSTLKRYMGWL